MAKTHETDEYKIDWYDEEVLLIIEELTAEALEVTAYDVASLARQNIVNKDLIDTGFMMNSTYAKGAFNSRYNDAVQAQGMNPKAEIFPDVNLESDTEAIVAVAAEYGLYVEMKQPYLYPALVEGSHRAGGHIQIKAKEKGFEGQ